MANLLLPVEERALTPAEVARLDRRRRRGHLLLVMGTQFTIMCVFMTLWSGQDLTYSPGWHRPMFYWDCLLGLAAVICIVRGIALRRGVNEFFSY